MTRPPSIAHQVGVLVALLLLLAASAGSSFLPMGAFNTVSNLGISVIKTLLVMAFFMRLRWEKPLLRIAAAVGFSWLFVLIALSAADYLTRMPVPPPW
jgi:cytochrome c oxidase subunit 4